MLSQLSVNLYFASFQYFNKNKFDYILKIFSAQKQQRDLDQELIKELFPVEKFKKITKFHRNQDKADELRFCILFFCIPP